MELTVIVERTGMNTVQARVGAYEFDYVCRGVSFQAEAVNAAQRVVDKLATRKSRRINAVTKIGPDPIRRQTFIVDLETVAR